LERVALFLKGCNLEKLSTLWKKLVVSNMFPYAYTPPSNTHWVYLYKGIDYINLIINKVKA
jgi:hypothetical protein